jgi:hypothetical protein
MEGAELTDGGGGGRGSEEEEEAHGELGVDETRCEWGPQLYSCIHGVSPTRPPSFLPLLPRLPLLPLSPVCAVPAPGPTITIKVWMPCQRARPARMLWAMAAGWALATQRHRVPGPRSRERDVPRRKWPLVKGHYYSRLERSLLSINVP